MKFLISLLDKATHFPSNLWNLFLDMGFYLMIGMFFSGLLHVLITKDRIARHLGANSRWAIIKGSLLGVPLPLCSCGVVPTAVGISKGGASIGAVTSFLISTPQTGIDSIIATAGMMGPLFAIFRPIAAFISGITGGFIIQFFSGNKKIILTEKNPHHSVAEEGGLDASSYEKKSVPPHQNKIKIIKEKMASLFHFGFIEFLDDIAFHMVIGLLIAALIQTFIDPEMVKALGITKGLSAMLIMILIGMPMYICATSSIPLALSFLSLGFSPGAVFVFLFAGPVTNAASIAVLSRTLGKKITAIYVGTVSILAILFGLLFDAIVKGFGIKFNFTEMMHIHSQESWKKLLIWGVALIFALLMVRALTHNTIKKIKIKLNQCHKAKQQDAQSGCSQPIQSHQGEKSMNKIELKIMGMSCQHCVTNVEKSIQKLPNIQSIHLNLTTSKAVIIGKNLSKESIIKAVKEVGYRVAP